MEALEQSGLNVDESNRDRIGVVTGTGIGGISTLLEQVEVFRERGPERVSPFLVPMMISDSAPGMIAIRFGVRSTRLATTCPREQ
jgi:3-oxoacyl-[acyl-carrier-protein] synthase II